MGHIATHAIVVARLITLGRDHGPHTFIVQLRSLDNHKPLSGNRHILCDKYIYIYSTLVLVLLINFTVIEFTVHNRFSDFVKSFLINNSLKLQNLHVNFNTYTYMVFLL